MPAPLRILILLLISTPLFAQYDDEEEQPQKKDTLKAKYDSTLVFWFNNNFDKFGKLNVKPADTGISGTQIHNPLYRYSWFYGHLGNLGTASMDLAPDLIPESPGFNFGLHNHDPYLFRNDSIRYYKVLKTYTDLKYSQGAKKEIFFDAVFSRNLYKSFNLGFNFRVFSSNGFYYRQKSNSVNFVLTAQYFTKNKRWGFIANLLLNNLRNQENGGIRYDSLFEQNIETNRQVIPVYLEEAQNRVKESGIYMKNYINLTRTGKKESDSLGRARRAINLGRILYTFNYNRRIQNYIDENPTLGYYPIVYFDTLRTYDSLTAQKISNELAWTNPDFNPGNPFKTLQAEFRIKHQYIEVTDLLTKSYLLQWIPSAAITFRPYKLMELQLQGDWVFGDYNDDDYRFRVDLMQVLGGTGKNFGNLTVTGIYSLQETDWFLHKMASNHFVWKNNFEKQGVIAGMAVYHWKPLEAGFSLSRIRNFVFLNQNALPEQVNGEFGYLNLWLNTNIDLWRFNFSGNFAYQTVQGSDALRLPAFTGNLTIYFTQQLFKGVSTIQPGLNFFYNTSYKANYYVPALRSFVLQDQYEIGNYLYMDIFLNVKIQRARFFLMYSHFNASFMGRNYYTVPKYPMPDGAFRFGLTWRFHD